MTDILRKRRGRLTGGQFRAESLEPRRLLAMAVGGADVEGSQGLSDPYYSFPDGSTQQLTANIQESGAFQTLSGNVSVEWWNGTNPLTIDPGNPDTVPIGGPALVTVPEANDADPPFDSTDVTVTLKQADAIAAGAAVTLPVDPNVQNAYPRLGTASPVNQYGQAISGTAYLLVGEFDGGSGFPMGWAQGIVVQFTAPTSPQKLAFIQQPQDTAEGDTIKPPITVAVENSSGGVMTSSNDAVTLALASGSGTLSGTTTEPAVDGKATFSNLSINNPGSYTLTATDATTSSTTAATSNQFNITGGKLEFGAPIKLADAGQPIAPDIVVSLKNGKGAVITSDSSTVVTLSPIGLTSGNPITGNTATLVNGVATFSSVVLTKPGSYILQASDGGDTTANTNKFKVSGDKLIFKVQPQPTHIKSPVPLTVEIENAQGKPDTNATTLVDLTLNIIKGGVGALLSGTLQLPFINGLAAFTSTNGPIINAGGTYTFTATEEDALTFAPTDTTVPVVSKQFDFGETLSYLKQPAVNAKVSVNRKIPFSIALKDAKGAIETTDSVDQIILSLYALTGGVPATTASEQFAQTLNRGVADFADISFSTPGTYYFIASAIDYAADGTPITIATLESHPFQVTGLQIKFLLQPGTSRGVNYFKEKVNQPLPCIVALKDGNGITDATDSVDQIVLNVYAITDGVPATTPVTTYTVVVRRGLADFGKLKFPTPGIFYLNADEFDATGSPVTTTPIEPSYAFQIN